MSLPASCVARDWHFRAPRLSSTHVVVEFAPVRRRQPCAQTTTAEGVRRAVAAPKPRHLLTSASGWKTCLLHHVNCYLIGGTPRGAIERERVAKNLRSVHRGFYVDDDEWRSTLQAHLLRGGRTASVSTGRPLVFTGSTGSVTTRVSTSPCRSIPRSGLVRRFGPAH